MRRRRAIPMPTREERERARLKAASADPLVWAMKTVDDKFPDSREKDAETIRAENEVEMKMGPANEEPELESEQEYTEEYGEDFDDSEEMDEDLLDESDILDDSDMLSTKMIDELSESKKKQAEKTETKVVNEPAKTATTNEKSLEIKAEDKLAMPIKDGVVTMEVTPMRQNVSGVEPEEVKRAPKEEIVEPEPKAKFKFSPKNKSNNENKDGEAKSQVKLMNLEFRQKKLMMGIAVLVILAVAGVSFGVIATVKQGLATEELADQVATNNDDEDDAVDGEYINLKDWGIKIKIIAGLDNVSFNTIMDEYAEVQIWGSKRDTSANYVPTFAKQAKNATPLGTMVRVPRYERAAAGRLIWYDDYYNYYYQGPSGVPNVSEDEMSWWVDSYLLIKEMLTNADNYITVE